MYKIFISFCSCDEELAKQVVKLLQLGVGMNKKSIFCTAIKEVLPTGEDYISVIRQSLKTCEMVIALITPEYLKSKFCMMELGAAWVEAPYLCPILSSDVDYKDFESTPMKSIQMRKMDNDKDWFIIYNDMVKRKMVDDFDYAHFHRNLDAFFQRNAFSV